MFPWGAIISLAGQAMSGISSAINNRRIQSSADAESSRRRAYYEAKANDNPLERSENKYLLGQYDRDAERQIENARNIAKITGATPEYGAAVQKAVAEGRSNLMGAMSAGASRRADYYNQLGERAAEQKYLEDQERRAARNQTYANLAANAASAAGAIIDSYGTGAKKAPAAPDPSTIGVVDDAQGLRDAEDEAYAEQERQRKAKLASGGAVYIS